MPLYVAFIDLTEDLEEAVSAYEVESLGEVDKRDVQGHMLFSTLLLELAKGEDHIHRRTFGTEAALRLGIDAFCHLLQADQDDSSKDLADDAKE